MGRYSETKWFIHNKKADFKAVSEKFGIAPVIARVLRNRDLLTDEEIRRFLTGSVTDLYDGSLLPDAEKAAALICGDIRNGTKIRIAGDYDIDGVCASYILSDGLRSIGADVSCVIPDRIRDGYGLNMSIIEDLHRDGIGTLVTCDNGIAAIEELGKAKEYGIRVIVTDHHELRSTEDGEEILPPADAIVSAKLRGSAYPEKEICGAVTAWKLLGLIYRKLGIPAAMWEKYLEFAGFATIGDVMKLTGENRIIAREALRRMTEGAGNTGLRALIAECGLSGKTVTCYHVGFVLGPCINAAGRLETAEKALALFLTEDEREAHQIARRLMDINDSRKLLTRKGQEEASEIVLSRYMEDLVLCVYLPELHESMAGIVAGRLKETFGKPSFVLTDSGEEEILKGSGRSVPAYNMFEGLLREAPLLYKFGGHPMAAGISVKRENLDALRESLNRHAGLTKEDLCQRVMIDAEMPMSYVSESLLYDLSRLEPFGPGNEQPVFAERGARPVNVRILGKSRNALRFTLLTKDGFPAECVMFGEAEELFRELSEKETVSVLYYPQLNAYNGKKEIQFKIEAFQ